MSERIEKLSIEANAQTGNEFDLNYKPLDAFLAKFAELIVRETIQTCEDHPAWTARMISEQIKEHFGIE
jgi:hypothetical protein